MRAKRHYFDLFDRSILLENFLDCHMAEFEIGRKFKNKYKNKTSSFRAVYLLKNGIFIW